MTSATRFRMSTTGCKEFTTSGVSMTSWPASTVRYLSSSSPSRWFGPPHMELAPLSMAFAFGSMVMICRWIIIHLPIITLARCLQSPSEHHNSVGFQDRYLINGNLLAPFFFGYTESAHHFATMGRTWWHIFTVTLISGRSISGRLQNLLPSESLIQLSVRPLP